MAGMDMGMGMMMGEMGYMDPNMMGEMMGEGPMGADASAGMAMQAASRMAALAVVNLIFMCVIPCPSPASGGNVPRWPTGRTSSPGKRE